MPVARESRSAGPTRTTTRAATSSSDFVAANMRGHGLYIRAPRTAVENVTLISSRSNSGLVADNGASGQGGTCSSSLVCTGTGASCSANSDCSSGVCTKNPGRVQLPGRGRPCGQQRQLRHQLGEQPADGRVRELGGELLELRHQGDDQRRLRRGPGPRCRRRRPRSGSRRARACCGCRTGPT